MVENKSDKETKNTASDNAETEQKNQPTTTDAAQTTDTASGDSSVKETLNKAKETVGQAATQVAGRAQEKASELLGNQKSNLAAGIGAIADSVRHIGEDLQGGNGKNQVAAFAGSYGDTVADRIEEFSRYVEDRDFREIARDTEQFARRNPALFIGGAFAIGLLAARIFKSSGTKKVSGKRLLKISGGETPTEKAAVQAS